MLQTLASDSLRRGKDGRLSVTLIFCFYMRHNLPMNIQPHALAYLSIFGTSITKEAISVFLSDRIARISQQEQKSDEAYVPVT